VSSTIVQLAEFARRESLVREFAYASGTAYGVLLDAWSPGWTRQMKGADDLGQRLNVGGRHCRSRAEFRGRAAEQAAERYGAAELRIGGGEA